MKDDDGPMVDADRLDRLFGEARPGWSAGVPADVPGQASPRAVIFTGDTPADAWDCLLTGHDFDDYGRCLYCTATQELPS